MTFTQYTSTFLYMAPAEHPNLSRLRRARAADDMSDRLFRAEVIRTMEERGPRGASLYTADEVAKAATLSRARVYQIINEAKTS